MSDQTAPPATLALMDSKGSAIEEWELSAKNTYYIGRGKNNDITLPFSWISRQHAMLQMEEYGVYNIIDLGSSNGTMVNGRRQHAATRLHSGDKLQIGSDKTTLVFLHDYTPEPPTEQFDIEEETVAFLQTELVTILVCDICNFTSLSENIGVESVSNILAAWSKKVNELVEHNNGSIDKFIGDAVMATWVGNDSQEQKILQAMRTSLSISEMTALLGDKVADLSTPLKVGGAINTGEAVMGNIGVDGGRDFTVVGDVVNLTFRLEELTNKVGVDLLLGATTSDYLEQCPDYFTRCKYVIKGKKEPVAAFGCSFEQLREYLQNKTS